MNLKQTTNSFHALVPLLLLDTPHLGHPNPPFGFTSLYYPYDESASRLPHLWIQPSGQSLIPLSLAQRPKNFTPKAWL